MAVTLLHAAPRTGAILYAFAGCELDVRARLLVTHGALVHLERKTFELLEYLVSNRDRAVTKNELNRALWGGCAVSDGALTQCIWTARRAIGQEKGRSSVIQTLNGVGYRFVGDVVVTYAASPPTPSSAPVSGENESLVVEALAHLSRARARGAALGRPTSVRLADEDAEENADGDDLLRAAIACRRFADSVLGATAGTRHAAGMSRR